MNFSKKLDYIAIFDEAGRGSLAGPVFVGCVVFPNSKYEQREILKKFEIIKDSKRLSEKKRKEVFEKIFEVFEEGDFSIGSATEKEIDEFGIVRAIEISCVRALKKISKNPNLLMFDGFVNLRKDFPKIRQISEPKLDETNPFCSLASILAKVSRDNFVKEKFKNNDPYGFLKHVGYGTEFHRKKILELGLSDFHRKSFVLKEAKNLKNESENKENLKTFFKNSDFQIFYKKEDRRKFGNEKEDLAEKYLLNKNYKILERNFGVRGVGELDIIAEKDDTIFFFEVRARRSKNFGKSIESVTKRKFERIKKTAEIWLEKNHLSEKNREFKLLGF